MTSGMSSSSVAATDAMPVTAPDVGTTSGAAPKPVTLPIAATDADTTLGAAADPIRPPVAATKAGTSSGVAPDPVTLPVAGTTSHATPDPVTPPVAAPNAGIVSGAAPNPVTPLVIATNVGTTSVTLPVASTNAGTTVDPVMAPVAATNAITVSGSAPDQVTPPNQVTPRVTRPSQVRPPVSRPVAGSSTTTTNAVAGTLQKKVVAGTSQKKVVAVNPTTLPGVMLRLSANPQISPSIYRVPKQLLAVNKSAYEPEMVRIGPYNFISFTLTAKLKLRYFASLLSRIPDKDIDYYKKMINEIEKEARNCYAELLSTAPVRFTEIMVLDSCFIIELMMNRNLLEVFSPVRSSRRILQRDLILLENQIPFFVLSKIFDLVESVHPTTPLVELVLSFFDDVFPGTLLNPDTMMRDTSNVNHILDLVYHHWCASSSHHDHKITASHHDHKITVQGSTTNSHRILRASLLKKANIKFAYKDCDSTTGLFDIKFTDGVLVMPTLPIDDWTESWLKNLIAYEQLLPQGKPTPVTDYALLLDCLIDTAEDVQILSDNNIIKNKMGSNDAVAAFVNKLTDKVMLHEADSMYVNIFSLINSHYKKSWNRALASFHQEYFSSPWAYFAFGGACVLLGLAITQTGLAAKFH